MRIERPLRWNSAVIGAWAMLCIGTLGTAPVLGDEAADAKTKAALAAALSKAAERKKFPEFDKVTKDTKKIDGLFPLYFNEEDQKLFMEISKSQYDKEIILPISIARGAGWSFLGGDTLNFGDQWIISFRRSADRIHVVRHNVRYKATSGKPQAEAVNTSYTDSIIRAIPIRSEKAGGSSVLIDLADLFMADLAGIGITPDRSRSTWAMVKGFEKNVEIEVSAVFSMGYSLSYLFGIDSGVADRRGAQVVVHYGLSMLPSDSDYKPRRADDRVGYFLSVVKDFSTDQEKTPFVRNVARWKLEKANASDDLSPPKEPITFWIEKSVPREYRKYVREGIEEWNKAFEKIGFVDAIQVRDQQDHDEFDPEDLRFNTFRWIATSTPFAMGPSRWNPKTGQILDADILFDESMVRYYKQDYLRRIGLPESLAMLRDGHHQAFFRLYAAEVPGLVEAETALSRYLKDSHETHTHKSHDGEHHHHGPSQHPGASPPTLMHQCHYGAHIQRQLGLIAAVLFSEGKLAADGKVPEEFIGQAIKEITMHEVGHTLGLRHNFKASTMLSLEDCNNPEITSVKGMAGSVMDYLPANIAPQGQKQGHYFSPTIGPYDYWAIEYAYKPIASDEDAELKKIASRIAEPGLDYGTDEDLWLSPDPRINTYDLGDPLEYAIHRTQLVKKRMELLPDQLVGEGEGWQRAREAFSVLLGELSTSAFLAAQYVGAEYSHRDHRGDPDGRAPLQPIPAAKQREAIEFLKKNILSDEAFQFSPKLLKRMPPEYWSHWGTGSSLSMPGHQYDIYGRVLSIQRIVLSRFLSSQSLRTLQNIELHAEEGDEVMKMPEVFEALSDAVWSELPEADGKVEQKIEISTIRRNLQREHASRLARMVLGPRRSASLSLVSLFYYDSYDAQVPADARALARIHLKKIRARIGNVIENKEAEVGDYARAHLEELHGQLGKVLDASFETSEL